MTSFPPFNSIDTLSINFSSSNSKSAVIYGNGNNQVAILVKLSLLDDQQKPVKVDQRVLANAVYLCDYYTGQKLSNEKQKGLFYSKAKNDYCNVVSWGSEDTEEDMEDDRFTTVQLYLSADGIYDGKVISCGIHIDYLKTGDIDTSENGTKNVLPDGSTYMHQNNVTVTSLKPIDYSDSKNVTITAGAFEELINNLGWESRLTTEGPYKGHTDGTCKRRIVTIRDTRQKGFKKHSITYNGIVDSDVNKGSIVWAYHSGIYEDCFDILRPGVGSPCAVIGHHNAANKEYQLNTWYSRQNSIHIDGHMYVVDSDYYYRFCPYVEEDHVGVDEKDSVTLLLYKFTIPKMSSSTWKYRWENVIRPVTVNVTDTYGNEGSFKLVFDDKENFDKPGQA